MTEPQFQMRDDEVRQFTVQHDDDGVRLDRWFKRHLPQIGFATVSRWARTGQIRIDGKRADPADRLVAGQTLRVPPGGALPPGGKQARARTELTEDQVDRAEAMLIHNDRAAIVLNKPPGLATQGGTGTWEHVDGLLDAFAPDGPRPRLVHRLDKDTSGVLLVARTAGSAAFFSRRFSGRTVRKVYWALVVGMPERDEGLIELPISKQPGTGGEKMWVDESGGGQTARTRYRVLDRAGNSAAWVELQPLTGRTHQLRVHMAAIGNPIVGDGKYGGPDAFLSGSISRKMHLHARRLIIEHPDGTPLDVTAPLPDHFAASMTQLGFDENDGEMLSEAPALAPAEARKQAAKAHAKQYRKERRGERRERKGGERGPAGRSAGRDSGKPGSAKAGAARTGPAKTVTAKTGTAKTGTAKTGTAKAGAKVAGPAPARSGPRKPTGAGKTAGSGRPASSGKPAASGKPTGTGKPAGPSRGKR